MTAGHPIPNREHEIPSVEQCSVAWFLKWPEREWALDGALIEKQLAPHLEMIRKMLQDEPDFPFQLPVRPGLIR
jgi:hypothetical protein